MAKSKQTVIKEIDNSVKNELKVFDIMGLNIFEDDYCLVMDNTPIVKNFTFDKPLRSNEHRIMLVKQGWVKHSLNYTECTTNKNEVLFIPAQFIIEVKDFSPDFKARVLSFNFSEVSTPVLPIDFRFIHLDIGYSESERIDKYFQLMYQILQFSVGSRKDFEFLVLSLMSRILGINNQLYGGRPVTFKNKRQRVVTNFLDLLSDEKIIDKTIESFAKSLEVSGNYLSIAVKDVTGHSVKYWVDYSNVTNIKTNLISSEHLSLNQIAEKLGYSSASTLVRYFKKQTGQTPAEYRKSVSNGQ